MRPVSLNFYAQALDLLRWLLGIYCAGIFQCSERHNAAHPPEMQNLVPMLSLSEQTAIALKSAPVAHVIIGIFKFVSE